MTNDKRQNSRKKFASSVIIALLSLLLIFSLMITAVPAVFADNGDEAGDTQPADTAAPTETAAPSDEPLATDTAAPSDEPLPADTSEPTVDTVPKPSELQTTNFDGQECVDGEVIVKFKDNVSDMSMERVLFAVDSDVQQELPVDNLVVTDVPEGETVGSFIETMEEQPDVEYAQPNYIYHVKTTVNDPYATPEYQWHLGTIGANKAWDITMGSSSIKVAVLDTGIDIDHPDLTGKIYAQYDYVNKDSTAQDDNGHGTHVSGIIAATANNLKGGAGVAPGVKLIPVKVLSKYGSGTTDSCVNGINYAVSHGADVINMSFGGFGQDTAMTDAINNAVNSGVVCVAAAGNEQSELIFTPSDIESCISVTATDEYDLFAEDFSNYGSAKDISAPGTSIYSTLNPDTDGSYYGRSSGTSMACPIVSGVAALVLSANPDLTVSQVKDILYSTAVDLGVKGKDIYYGFGRVDAEAAVNKVILRTPKISSAVSTGYNSISLAWGEMDGAAGYEVWRSTSAVGVYTRIASGITDTTFNDSGLTAGNTYYYKVKVYYTSGTETIPGYFSAYKDVKPVPFMPESISATPLDYDSIKIEWSSVPGASGYIVYRATSESGTYSKITTTSKTYYTNNYVSTGTAYYYKVRAYSSSTSIYGDYSPFASTFTSLKPMENVTAKTYYPTSIKISWSSVPGRTRYEILRSLTGLEGSFLSYKTTASTYYKDTGLKIDQAYYYQVRAYRTVSGKKVYNDASDPASDTTRVFQVTGQKAAMYSVTSNRVSWSSVTGASGYEVSRCDAGGKVTLVFPTTGHTYFYDKTITPGQTYYYTVRAYRTASGVKRYGDYSGVATCLSKVAGIKAAMYTVNSNKISWSCVSSRYKYEVWKSDSSAEETSYWTETSSTYIYDRNLNKDKTYYYKVRAYQIINGEKVYCGFSDTVSADNMVTGAKAVSYSYMSNKITWSAVAGRTGYKVYWSDTKDGDYTEIPTSSVITNTYFYHTGLTTDKMYYYKVLAYQKINNIPVYSGYSDIVYAAPALKSVTGAKAVKYNSTKIKLTWSAASGATGYEIQRCTTGIETDFKIVKETTNTSTYYYDGGLIHGTKYYFRIRAYRNVGGNTYYGGWSKTVYATP